MKVGKYNILNKKKKGHTLKPVFIVCWCVWTFLEWIIFSKLQTDEWGNIALNDIYLIITGIFPGLLFFDKIEVCERNSRSSNHFDIVILFCWNIAVMIFREVIAIGTGAFLGTLDGVIVLSSRFLLVESMIIILWFLVIPAVFITSILIWLIYIEFAMIITGEYYILLSKYISTINCGIFTLILIVAVIIAGIISYIISCQILNKYCKRSTSGNKGQR